MFTIILDLDCFSTPSARCKIRNLGFWAHDYLLLLSLWMPLIIASGTRVENLNDYDERIEGVETDCYGTFPPTEYCGHGQFGECW